MTAAIDPLDEAEPRPPAFSDEDIALAFAELHAADMRYVATWGKWMLWTGQRWRQDDTKRAFDLVRGVCREFAAACNVLKVGKAIASAKTRAAVESLATGDRRLAATVDQWDANDSFLNTPGGVVDLTTGRIVPHDPGYYATKITAVGPGGACRLWRSFLDRVCAGDIELIEFLQRCAGYALSGSTREHALFFLYGVGANGKSVFLNTISAIMADYHTASPVETFTQSTGEQHPTGLASLRGARLVTAVETEEGRRWAEARIKQMTGGDPITARFMRQDFFTFAPRFKLFIAGNHKPALRTVDEAMKRRMNLIPFAVVVPTKERDPDLKDKLKEEWPGILAWMIEGCLQWQAQGLSPPKVVRDATEAYLVAEDALSAWIEEACVQDPNGWETSTNLFASWKGWTERTGEYTGNMKRFVQSLDTHGFPQERRMKARGFIGLKLEGNGAFSGPDWDR